MTREEIEMIRERCFATDEDFVKVLSETVSHKDMLKARREYHSVTHEEFVSYPKLYPTNYDLEDVRKNPGKYAVIYLLFK